MARSCLDSAQAPRKWPADGATAHAKCLDADLRFESDWANGLREVFEQHGIEATRDGALLQRVGTAVDSSLVQLQRRLYGVLRDSFKSGPVHDAAT